MIERGIWNLIANDGELGHKPYLVDFAKTILIFAHWNSTMTKNDNSDNDSDPDDSDSGDPDDDPLKLVGIIHCFKDQAKSCRIEFSATCFAT